MKLGKWVWSTGTPENALKKFNSVSKLLIREGEIREVGVVDWDPEKALAKFNTSKPLEREEGEVGEVGVVDRGQRKLIKPNKPIAMR